MRDRSSIRGSPQGAGSHSPLKRSISFYDAMKCFGLGESSPPTTLPGANGSQETTWRTTSASTRRPRYRRKNSLTLFLESLFTPPPSPRSHPSSPPSSSSNRRSWGHGQRPTISYPRPLSFYPAEPDSNLSRAVRAAFEGLPSPVSPSPQELSTCSSQAMESIARTSYLNPAAASSSKLKQIKAAQEMTKRVEERAKKSGATAPAYEFLELIGKGSFGRVFKSRRKKEQDLVAVKIIDVDSSDYKLGPAEKDQAIKDFVVEISILHTLKDSKAKNVNIIYEAFNFHSQLWIVSEYCPGGSVSTLLKASPKPGLEEKYIIAISRELAVALKYVHEAGIIHRDVKAANVLITQDGQLQLCDFGVSGILESSAGKRSTIIGTPFWMPPEMHDQDEMSKGYGTEVDCWAFGCTVYELATGLPPNANIAPQRLHMFLTKAPRLEGGEYSPALREFVSFCLEERPENRPTADGILKHSFVANTSKRYPTTILRQLIERFTQWESAGGQRASLFQQHGASAPTAYDPFAGDEEDEWNFSTTDDFSEEVFPEFSPKTPDTLVEFEADEETPRQKSVKTMTPFEKAQQEQRAIRGGRQMARLFDENAEPYEYNQDDEDAVYMSDLPLRRGSTARSTADRETIIDLDDARISQDLSSAANVDLDNVQTIKAQRGRLRFLDDDDDEDSDYHHNNITKRLTRDWRFPGAGELTAPANMADRPRTQDWTMAKATADARYASQSADEDNSAPTRSSRHLAPPFRPSLKHTTTEPVGNFGDFLHPNSDLSAEPPDRASMIDIDGEPGFNTLSRQHSFASSAGESSATEYNSSDPFYLDDQENVIDGGTIRAKRNQRTSFHMHSQSEPSAGDRSSNGYSIHTRGSSLSSDPEFERQQRHELALGSAPLSRDISVKNSVDSLRLAAAVDDFWDREVVSGSHLGVKKQPMLNGRGLGRNWANYDTDDGTNSAVDADTSDVDGRGVLLPPTASAGSSFQSRNASNVSKLGGRGRPLHHARNRSKLGQQDREVSGDPVLDSTGEEAIGRVPPYGQHRRVVSFPRPRAPDPAALEEDAEDETVVSEMDRMLDDLCLGLRAAGRLLGDVDGEYGPIIGFDRSVLPGHSRAESDHGRAQEASRSVSGSED